MFASLKLLALLATTGPALSMASSAQLDASAGAYQCPPTTGFPQCDALIAAGLSSVLLVPGSAPYESRIASWWSLNARLRPFCIVQPRTAHEVARTLTTLAKLPHGNFAVRSGGHSHWTGGSNIANGVTIDLAHFNQTVCDAKTGIASLGPAQRWGDVFEALEAKGVMVPGGRDGDVGVGGLLTGGGNSYYTGRHGFVCDSLVNAEVVLASGEIVHANAHSHADLWKALKGGLSNFGIVTRFDVQAFQAPKLWGGLRVSDKKYTPEAVSALVNFTKENHKYPQDAFIINFTYNPATSKDIVLAHVVVDTDGVEKPPAFDEILKVPASIADVKVRSMSNIANTYILPAGLRNVWFTLTFKNDPRIVSKSASLHETFVSDLLKTIPADELTTQSLWQPVPYLFASLGREKGGNVLGLDQTPDQDALLWLCAVSVKSAEHEDTVRLRAAQMTRELKAYGERIGVGHDWIYVNYADPSQDPFASYGEANVQFMKAVAAKYDPEGVFQKMVPGSFRISRTA